MHIEFDLYDVVVLLSINLLLLLHILIKGKHLMSAGSNLVDAVTSLENSANALGAAAAAIIAAKADAVAATDAQPLADRINAVAVSLTNTANSMK